jgi:integrase
VQLAGHFGLRPQEIRKVRWSDLSAGALMIGASRTKKTAQRTRVIIGPAAAIRELRAWQLRSAGRGSDLIIPEMSPNAVRLWNRRVLRTAVKVATAGRITDATVYTLRHSHASALHYTSFTLREILGRLGHAQQSHFAHYAHVIESISGKRYASLDDLIEDARRNTGGTAATLSGSS